MQRFRDQALATTTADFRRLADALEGLKTTGDVVVLGGREALDGAALDLAITRVM